HLELGWADKEHLHPFKLRQQVGQRSCGASFVEFTDDGHAEAVQRTLTVNSVEIEQGLRGMLATVAISGIDHRDGRNFRGAARAVIFGMTDYDHVGIAANNANGVFYLLAFDLGRE